MTGCAAPPWRGNEATQETKMNIVQPPAPPLPPELVARFRKVVGDEYAVTDQADIAPYVTEERDLFRGRSPLSTESRWCRRAAIPAWSAARPRTMARWWSRCGGWTRSATSTPPPTP